MTRSEPDSTPRGLNATGPEGPDERLVPRSAAQPGRSAERSGGFVRVRSAADARRVLRARQATTQAGFTSEFIPKHVFRRHPILFSDGPRHDAQRSELARFFAPAVVEARYRGLMEASADELIAARPTGAACRFDVLALRYSVAVSARIVGLTESPTPRLARRLAAFFRQPPVDMSRDDLGRTRAQWALAAWRGLVPLARFGLADVLPAIRARRRTRRSDVVSTLLDGGASDLDILVECVTYGTAGMVTTREFIALAAWRLLSDARLRAQFQDASREERLDLLAELLRLDPVVGRLYRRVVETIPAAAGEADLARGDLVEIEIDAANTDPATVGACPYAVDARRPLPPGVDRAGWSFGDGAHRCPGRHLALLQAEALLARLLDRDAELVRPPTVVWDSLLAGYGLRDMVVRWR